jgi:hypothetical protein
MEFFKSLTCSCGNEKPVEWLNKDEYLKGDIVICGGVSECDECGIQQGHYIGDSDALMELASIMELNVDGSNTH